VGLKARWHCAGLALAIALLLAACDPSPAPAARLWSPPDCDPRAGLCRAQGAGHSISLGLPGPAPQPLEPFTVTVTLAGLAASEVLVQFQMEAMDMGRNRFRLAQVAAGHWQGEVMLPVCWSGRRDWRATVQVVADGDRFEANFAVAIDG